MDARLILHADDLGMNRAVNEGILRGFREGLLTSTSLLANAPDVESALRQWRMLEEERAGGTLPSAAKRRQLDDSPASFDLGVHLNLTQGRPLTDGYPAELLDAQGRFAGVFSLFGRLLRRRRRFRAAIRAELERQMQLVLDHGLRPTHVNGHQYIEMIPAVAEILATSDGLLGQFRVRVVRVAREPSLLQSTLLRGQLSGWAMGNAKRAFAKRFQTRMDALGIAHPAAFFGTMHAGNINLDLLRVFLVSGRKHRSIEIGLHPAEPSAPTTPADWLDGWHDPLAAMRPDELRMIVSDELPATVERSGRRLGRLTPK
ncbi:MAG: ChbG/HpnK family deacetylase [Planctomycetaceae bacterium]|nr:ChbG/HpnK family deacetylase [Planctomycetaceae bacterium]